MNIIVKSKHQSMPKKVLNVVQSKCSSYYGELKKAELRWNKQLKAKIRETNVQTMVATMTAWSYPLQTALPGVQ